jgi:hypothetical protein
MPETLLFSPPIQFLQFSIGSPATYEGGVYVEAFDFLGNGLDNNSLDTQSALQTISISGHGISRVVVTTTSSITAIDDLQFTQEAPCAHGICYGGEALDRNCDLCTEVVCDAHPECCSSEWTSACALTVEQVCEVTCLPLCGDANDDRVITASDALVALKVSVGVGTCDVQRCDYSGDGLVTASDALAILKTSVGIAVIANCPPAL